MTTTIFPENGSTGKTENGHEHPAQALAERLGPARPEGARWRTTCPACNGHNLTVGEGEGGRVLVFCWNGCSQAAVIERLRGLGLWGGTRGGPNGTGTGAGALDGAEWWAEHTTVPWSKWELWGCRAIPGGVAFVWSSLGGVVKRRLAAGPKGLWVGSPCPPLWPEPPAPPAELPDTVWLAEGESDCGVLRHAGLPAYACTKGAAGGLPGEVLAELRRRGCKRVVVAFDHDEAGRQGGEKLARAAAAAGLLVSVIEWDGLLRPSLGEKDVRDLSRRLGDPERLRAALEAAVRPWTPAGSGGSGGEAGVRFDSTTIYCGPVVKTNPAGSSGAAPPAPPVSFRSPRELLADTPEEVPWVWPGFVARGALTVLGGREKSGKSTLLWALIAAVLSGRDFCGQPTAQTPVVALTEESPATAAEKLQRFGIAPDAPLSILTRGDVRGRPAWEAVVAAAGAEAERLSAGLIVIDTLAYWAALPPDAENSAGAMTEALRPLLELAGRGVAVLALHHVDKAHGELRGSTAIGAMADVVVTLSREAEAPTRRRLEVAGRFSECRIEPLLIELSGDGYTVLGSPREVAAEERERQVLAALPTGEGRTQRELAEVTGLPQQRVAAALARLTARGVVVRTGEGTRGDPYRYVLCGRAAADADADADAEDPRPAPAEDRLGERGSRFVSTTVPHLRVVETNFPGGAAWEASTFSEASTFEPGEPGEEDPARWADLPGERAALPGYDAEQARLERHLQALRELAARYPPPDVPLMPFVSDDPRGVWVASDDAAEMAWEADARRNFRRRRRRRRR